MTSPSDATVPTVVHTPTVQFSGGDLNLILWLIDSIWATGRVESTEQASELLSLSQRVRAIASALRRPPAS